MKSIIMVTMILMVSTSSNAWCRNSSGHSGYHNNHYQSKNDYGFKKNEYKRLNYGY